MFSSSSSILKKTSNKIQKVPVLFENNILTNVNMVYTVELFSIVFVVYTMNTGDVGAVWLNIVCKT